MAGKQGSAKPGAKPRVARLKDINIQRAVYLGPILKQESECWLPSPEEVARRLSNPASVAWMERLALEAGHRCPSSLEAALEAALGYRGKDTVLEAHWTRVASILASGTSLPGSGTQPARPGELTTTAAWIMAAQEVGFDERER